jgi:hypothetical protein
MTLKISDFSPRSGQIIKDDGVIVNEADILDSAVLGLTVLESVARTADVASGDQGNLNARGLHAIIDVTGAPLTNEQQTITVDATGGTFTITNGGVFGSLVSTPILNMPQSAILGMHAIQERPVAVDGEVVIRPMMYLAMSYDHRIVDGKDSVQFLVAIKRLLEDPARLLLDL